MSTINSYGEETPSHLVALSHELADTVNWGYYSADEINTRTYCPNDCPTLLKFTTYSRNKKHITLTALHCIDCGTRWHVLISR